MPYVNNKDSDQPAYLHSQNQRSCCLLPVVAISEIPRVARFSGRAGQFESYLEANTKGRFSRHMAHMSHIMRKPVYAICKQQMGADQPVHLGSLINAFVFRCLDSMILQLAIAEILKTLASLIS